MSILNSSIVPVGSTGYDIDNSVRLDYATNAYLDRTTVTTGNRRTSTFSAWVKLSDLKAGVASDSFIWSVGGTGAAALAILWKTYNDTDYFVVNTPQSTGASGAIYTPGVYRDTSAWYHILLSIDTTHATATERVILYVNGERVISSNGVMYPPLNFDTNMNLAGQKATLGKLEGIGRHFGGYLAEVNFVDGQALTPSDFGETGDYGEWKAKKYTGTYGTNGFYLDFKNSGSLGNDANGSNNWTPNNLAATDQMLDSPTNNFATLNPLSKATTVTVSEGNLKASVAAGRGASGTGGMATGKWYFENTGIATTSNGLSLGLVESTKLPTDDTFISAGAIMYYGSSGNKYVNAVSSAYGASYTAGDIIGIAVDRDGDTVTFYKNNVSQGSIATSSLSGTLLFHCDNGTSAGAQDFVANFGQDSSFAGNKTAQGNQDGNGIGDFYYTPPTGFLALCTQNLPEPTVVPSEHFDVRLRTGTGSEVTVSDLDFQPDLLWTKTRSNTVNHNFHSSLMSNDYSFLQTNSTSAENNSASTYYMTPTSTGYTVGTGDNINQVSYTFVDWLWKANGAGVSNTNGTITSTVSANADAGFSIVSYTGTGSNGTVGHGLSSAPEMVILKSKTDTKPWKVGHTGLTSWVYRLHIDTAAEVSEADVWNSTSPTSSVFSIGTDSSANWSSSSNYIAYCFHSVEGYSKVGSYTGNGSADGTFVHCGFRPAYVMTKRASTAGSWHVYDSTRDVDNDVFRYLMPDGSYQEYSAGDNNMDFVSNGFKLRSSNTGTNENGTTTIYLAFAEHPFKYTNAR